jgi:hypothetical protein
MPGIYRIKNVESAYRKYDQSCNRNKFLQYTFLILHFSYLRREVLHQCFAFIEEQKHARIKISGINISRDKIFRNKTHLRGCSFQCVNSHSCIVGAQKSGSSEMTFANTENKNFRFNISLTENSYA